MRMQLYKRMFLAALAIGLWVPAASIYLHYRADMSQAYQRISMGSKVVNTACGPIEYTEFGQGAPVLIVHGSGGGYDQGEYFARLIGGGYRWIAPSRFGFLHTPAPEGSNSVLQADAHACLLDALGIERVGVIGVSLGGPSALLFAQRYPQRVTSLVMGSAASYPIPPRPAMQAAIFKVFLNDFVYWTMVHTSKQGLLEVLGVPMAVQKDLPPEQLERAYAFLEDMMPMGARLNGQLLEGNMSNFDTSLLRSIQAPTLVVHARDDTLVPFEHGVFTAKEVPNAQMIEVEKGGHLALIFDINAGSRTEITKFLAQYNQGNE